MKNKTVSTLVLTIALASCSSKLESKLVGSYYINPESTRDSGRFLLDANGDCGVVDEDDIKDGGGYSILSGVCKIEGNVIIMKTSGKPTFGYPEFRSGTTVLTIDGSSLVSQSGRRFIKEDFSKEDFNSVGVSSNSSTSSSSSSSSGSGKITTEKAQTALDIFSKPRGTGTLKIIGHVQELPAHTGATADLDVADFRAEDGETFQGKGVASFEHLSDGRWVLTNVRVYNGNITRHWETQITLK